MKHLFFLFICLTFYCQIASAQNGSEIWYALPLYQSDDPTGKFVSHIIDAELTNLAMKNKLPGLKRLSFDADTSLKKFYQQNSLTRDNQGFIDPTAIRSKLEQFNIPLTKLLLIYDVTANREFTSWKPPKVILTPYSSIAGSIIIDNLSNANLNHFDSLWCKISLIDFNNPSFYQCKEVIANEQTCSSEPVDCILETIQKIGKSTNSTKGKTELQFIESPSDQHWGKIVGGSLLFAGGIGLIALSPFMLSEFAKVAVVSGGAIAGGGATLLTIGIIRQAHYSR